MAGTADLYSRAYARHFSAKRATARANAEAARAREAERRAAGIPSFDERWRAALAEAGGNTRHAHEIMNQQDAKNV